MSFKQCPVPYSQEWLTEKYKISSDTVIFLALQSL